MAGCRPRPQGRLAVHGHVGRWEGASSVVRPRPGAARVWATSYSFSSRPFAPTHMDVHRIAGRVHLQACPNARPPRPEARHLARTLGYISGINTTLPLNNGNRSLARSVVVMRYMSSRHLTRAPGQGRKYASAGRRLPTRAVGARALPLQDDHLVSEDCTGALLR